MPENDQITPIVLIAAAIGFLLMGISTLNAQSTPVFAPNEPLHNTFTRFQHQDVSAAFEEATSGFCGSRQVITFEMTDPAWTSPAC